MEPSEAASDLVGRTSARLLAAGVERRERLDALHLLAILDASTDVDGRVRRPIDDLAAEFELHPMAVLSGLDHLEEAGAVRRDGGAVVLLGTSPEGLGGMHLAEFLDDVRASLDHDDVVVVPMRRRARMARGGAALLAAAAAVAVFTVAPTRQPAVEQPLAIGRSTTTADAAAATTSSMAARATSTTSLAPDSTPSEIAPASPFVPETSVGATAACPTGSPVAEVIAGVIRIWNPTTEDIVVNELSVGGTSLRSPIDVAAGTTVLRDAPGTVSGVIVVVESWDWADPTVGRTCTS